MERYDPLAAGYSHKLASDEIPIPKVEQKMDGARAVPHLPEAVAPFSSKLRPCVRMTLKASSVSNPLVSAKCLVKRIKQIVGLPAECSGEKATK